MYNERAQPLLCSLCLVTLRCHCRRAFLYFPNCSTGRWRYFFLFKLHSRFPQFNKTLNYFIRLDLDRVKHNYLCFSDPSDPSYFKLAGLHFFFFAGDANDPKVQADIKTNYLFFMTSSGMVPPLFCSSTVDCKEDSIEVYAGSSGITDYNKG